MFQSLKCWPIWCRGLRPLGQLLQFVKFQTTETQWFRWFHRDSSVLLLVVFLMKSPCLAGLMPNFDWWTCNLCVPKVCWWRSALLMLSQSLACGILMSVCYTPHPSCLYGIVPHSCCSSSHLLKKHQLSCNDPKSVDQLLLYPMLDSYTVQLEAGGGWRKLAG